MKKLILFAVMLFICFSLVSVSAANERGSLTITGTTQTQKDNLAVVKVSASSNIEASTISGSLSYDKNLTVFEVEKSDNLGGWNFSIDTSTSGQIKFSGTYSKGGDGPIESDRTLFTVTFIVVGEGNTTLTSTASGKGKVVEEVETLVDDTEKINEAKKYNEENNLSPGDAGYHDPEAIPKISKMEKKEVEKAIDFDKASYTIKVNNPKSNDTYLKSITVDDATISPSFSKLTSAYKVTIDSEKDINIHYVKEDENATVLIQQEVNNQIVMTVTAEDGSTSAYVLTIVRVKNYDSTSENPIINPDIPTSPTNDTAGFMGMEKNVLITLIGGGAASIVGLLIGTVLVVKGKRDMGY